MKNKMLWKTTLLKADMRILQQLRILYTRHQDLNWHSNINLGILLGQSCCTWHTEAPQPQHHRSRSLPLAAAACSYPVLAALGQLWEKEELLSHRKPWQGIRKRQARHRNYNLSKKFSYLGIHMAHCHNMQVPQDSDPSPSWSSSPSSFQKLSQYHWPAWPWLHFELAPSFSLLL